MERHGTQTIQPHHHQPHHHHNHHHHHHHHMDHQRCAPEQLQPQHDSQQQQQHHHQQHRCGPESQLHLAQQQDHYQQYQQHEQDQHQLSVGLQQQYQATGAAPVELGCANVHYGYTSVGYGPEQYEQQAPQPGSGAPPDTSEPEAAAPAAPTEVGYRLRQPVGDQKPPIIDEWELSEHHLHQHHASSFAYINNYPFHSDPNPNPNHNPHQQQQHEHLVHQQHHLLASSQPPVQAAPAEPAQLHLVVASSPPVQLGQPPASDSRGDPKTQEQQHPRTRQSKSQNATNRAHSNSNLNEESTRPRSKKHTIAPALVDQLESKYPKKIKIGDHEEIEYQRDRVIVRDMAQKLEITFTNKELSDTVAKNLNRKLAKASSELTLLVKSRRRTLKNRGYAANCRTKREADKKNLEEKNKLLEGRVNKLALELAKTTERLQLALSASCNCLRQQIQQMAF